MKEINYMERQSGIYCIENISTGKKYVGQSIDVHSRWQKHRSELNNNTHHNSYLQNAWNKYGENDFKFYIFEYCNVDELDNRETYYINIYDLTNRDLGYNLKSGGQENGAIYSEEVKEKMRKSAKQYYIEHPERREQLRKSTLEYWANEENRKKRSGENASMYGKHHTLEAKKKMSDARIGVVNPKRNTTPVYCIELQKSFKDAATAAKELHLDSSGIIKVCRNERKTCGKFHWTFLNLEE